MIVVKEGVRAGCRSDGELSSGRGCSACDFSARWAAAARQQLQATAGSRVSACMRGRESWAELGCECVRDLLPGGVRVLYIGVRIPGVCPLSQANVIRLDQLTVRTILAPINLSHAFAEIPSPAQYTLYVRVHINDMWASSSTKSQSI